MTANAPASVSASSRQVSRTFYFKFPDRVHRQAIHGTAGRLQSRKPSPSSMPAPRVYTLKPGSGTARRHCHGIVGATASAVAWRAVRSTVIGFGGGGFHRLRLRRLAKTIRLGERLRLNIEENLP